MKNFLARFFSRPSGFGSAGISRQRECGAITITGTGLSSAQYGAESDEVGLNLESIEVRYYREVNVKLQNIKGQTRGRALADKFSRDVTIQGEVIGATGLMALTSASVAATFANDSTDFGATSGSFIFDEGTITQNRTGWRSANIKLSSDPEL